MAWMNRALLHHSMIWSACTRTDSGIVSPSALAVFELKTSIAHEPAGLRELPPPEHPG